jgi:membrane fusion protein, copper/silver efflux system
MKKPFFTMLLTILLIGSFLGGAWYSHQGAGRNSGKDRRILHYVDPMNPVNVSDKPGIAPCGMPMEPVYGDAESAGSSPPGTVLSMSPGVVNISLQKQQIIGVQVGVVERTPGNYEVRALGRITPDENRVYPLIAATDGWMRDVQGSTTGSVVKKNQLMARINIYSNDFFTWQQQYLTELNKSARLKQPETTQPEGTQPAQKQPSTKYSIAEYYADRARLELLNLGVGEAQLEDLVRIGQFGTYVEVRSPVAGLVLSRNISPHQKVDRGTECFRIADISRVWVIADVFNAEAQYIRPGMHARISLPGQSKHYEARVSDVLPKFDATARSLKVRLEMDNPKNMLLPETFVDVEFRITLPAAVTVPASAILDSGRKKTVFVALGDGFFEPRYVVTGWRFDDRVEIVAGLMPGDRIVTSGNFLIDSESRMRLAAAGLSGTPENDPPEKMPQSSTSKTIEDMNKMNDSGPAEHKHD